MTIKLNFIEISITVKCTFWQMFNKIAENQDLYRNKEDF